VGGADYQNEEIWGGGGCLGVKVQWLDVICVRVRDLRDPIMKTSGGEK